MDHVHPVIASEVSKEGRKLTKPLKQKYDDWMNVYKKWVDKFYLRGGRRLICRI